MATKIKPFNLDATVDTHVQGLIDSSYINARTESADSSSINTLVSSTRITGKIVADIRINPNTLARTHVIDSNDNGLLVGPLNIDSDVTLTVNGTLLVI